MGIIEFHGVNKWFGAFQVLKNIDFSVEEGEVTIGPSGKSTPLLCINGLEEFTPGELIADAGPRQENQHQRATNRAHRALPELDPAPGVPPQTPALRSARRGSIFC